MTNRFVVFFSAGLLAAIFFACSNPSNGQTNTDATVRPLDSASVVRYQQAFAHFFDSLLLQSRNFSGGILVAKNGQILYEQYAGFSDGAKTDSIDADTRFHVASTSKTFTSIAIMQQVRAGKLKLDDSIQVYFPLFPYQGITVRTLLNHSSGLPNYANLFPSYKWNPKQTATNTDVLYLFYANRPPLEFKPATRFRYCNTNFALLALIVEKTSGQFFPDYVRDSIFKPAGMSASYVLNYRNIDAYIPSWDGAGRIYDFNYLDAIYGDKNVFTNCRDLWRYDSAIRVQALLPQALLDTAWLPNFPDKKYNDSIEYYGLGWRLKVFNDTLKIPYHNGWWHGNNSVFQRVIADTAVIIVMGNRFSNRIYASAKAANIFRTYYTHFDEEIESEQGQSGRKQKISTPRKTGVPYQQRKSGGKR